jgi:hypothetical protein
VNLKSKSRGMTGNVGQDCRVSMTAPIHNFMGAKSVTGVGQGSAEKILGTIRQRLLTVIEEVRDLQQQINSLEENGSVDLSGYVKRDGSVSMTGDLDLDGNNIDMGGGLIGSATFRNNVFISGVADNTDARVIVTRASSSKAAWVEYDTGSDLTAWLFGQQGSSNNFSINYWDGGSDHFWMNFNPTGEIEFSGKIQIASHPPANASAEGNAGTIAWDSGFIYICVADNTWKRVAISTW